MDLLVRLGDRFSLTAVKFLAVLHLALLFCFAQMLVAVSQARAQDATQCGGKDLLPQIEAHSPGALERMKAEAATIPNGKGLLWKIEKAGAKPSWLYGTMHLTDARVTGIGPSAKAAFDGADAVVIETTDVLDPIKFAATIAAEPSLTSFTGDETLKSVLPAETYSEVEKALQDKGIPPYSVRKMKPWFLTTMLAVPACEASRKMAGLSILDQKLAEDAADAGKEVLGLESGIEQLRAMNAVPMEFHVKGLVGMLKIGDEMNDLFETMTQLYVKGEIGMFKPLFKEAEKLAPGVAGGDDGYADFEQIMVDKRNLTMANNAEPILAKGNAFIAVGALHLPGDKGLVEEFRRRGYTVTAVN